MGIGKKWTSLPQGKGSLERSAVLHSPAEMADLKLTARIPNIIRNGIEKLVENWLLASAAAILSAIGVLLRDPLLTWLGAKTERPNSLLAFGFVVVIASVGHMGIVIHRRRRERDEAKKDSRRWRQWLRRADDISGLPTDGDDQLDVRAAAAELYHATLTLLIEVYGDDSVQVARLKQIAPITGPRGRRAAITEIRGALQALMHDLQERLNEEARISSGNLRTIAVVR